MSWLFEHMYTVKCVCAGTYRVSELRREQERARVSPMKLKRADNLRGISTYQVERSRQFNCLYEPEHEEQENIERRLFFIDVILSCEKYK
jgi:hypothetical protein